MKNVITALFLFVSCAIFAQDLVNITYVSVARENSEEFLDLHKKFTNMSMGEERTIIQSAVFANAFAGDYTFAVYDFYNTEVALVTDAAISTKIMDANIKALNLDEKAQVTLDADYKRYVGMFVEGHSDQIRSFKGLEELSFSNEDIDWSTKKVVVVSKYDTQWSKNKDFTQAMKDGNIKALKESGKVALTVTSRHLYGSGMDWHSYMFYNSWSDFASYP